MGTAMKLLIDKKMGTAMKLLIESAGVFSYYGAPSAGKSLKDHPDRSHYHLLTRALLGP
jgi:hypothetical protein